ncbi:MAG: hypothetical protein N2C14_20035, partial [Planctomycetales bacterium]
SKTPLSRTRIPLAISQDGRLLAEFRSAHPTTINYPIILRDPETATEKKTLAGLQAYPLAARFSPDGSRLVACGRRENRVLLWETNGAGEPLTLINHAAPVQAVAFSQDGRQLVTASWDKTVCVWEVVTAKPIAKLAGHTEHVCAVNFSRRGRFLASGASGKTDNTVLVWNLRELLLRPSVSPDKLDAEALAEAWKQLTAEDPKQAYPAMGSLTAAPGRAVAFLRDQLNVKPLGADGIAVLIRQLDDEDFFVRDAAHRKLLTLRDAADKPLRQALLTTQSPEVGYRIRAILQASGSKSTLGEPERRRMHRAVQVLELIGSDDAQALLSALASGHIDPGVMKESASSLDRLQEPKDPRAATSAVRDPSQRIKKH